MARRVLHKKLPRNAKYEEMNSSSRLAILHITNAISRFAIAERLHPSRQAAHLLEAENELREANGLLQRVRNAAWPLLRYDDVRKDDAAGKPR